MNECVGYVLTFSNGKSIYVTGDTSKTEQMPFLAEKEIDYAMENGINYFDSAYVYHGGESEKFLGEAMKKYPRDSYYFATKFLLSANPDYKAVFEEQLARLQTDHIDFYLLHAIFDGNCQNYLDSGCIEYFLEQKKEGRIRYLGFSSHAGVEALTKMADHHQWDFAQLQLSYFDWLYARRFKAGSGRGIGFAPDASGRFFCAWK